MSRITISDVKTTFGLSNTYDIMNAITNSGTPEFQQYVPLANADNVTEVGQALQLHQNLQNEFITSLVERIGLVVVRQKTLQNPLKKFKKGMMPLGRTIEEIFVDITESKLYDPEDAEQTVFKREIPNVRTLFHERNRQEFYEQTIQDDSLRGAFVSWGHFDNFVAGVMNAIYNTAEVDEFKYMKLLVDNYYSKGLFTVVKTEKPDTQTNAEQFIKKVRATATKMTLPFGSRDFNSLAVHTRSNMEDLHIFITADLDAQISVDVLAKAFNMDKTTLMGNITIVDNFASPNIEAVMVDKDWYMVYDQMHKMETIRNPRGLYWNYYYHIWQVLSVSRFANAVAFVSGDDIPPVTQVILDPTILSIKQGRTHQYTTYVRNNDGEDYKPVFEVKGRGYEVSFGTTIDDNGLLTIGEDQEGELIVTATVTYKDGDEEKEVIGESVVTVLPESK